MSTRKSPDESLAEVASVEDVASSAADVSAAAVSDVVQHAVREKGSAMIARGARANEEFMATVLTSRLGFS